MAETIVNLKLDEPTIEAPIEVSFGSVFEGIKSTIDGIVDNVRSGNSDAITGMFLAGMFVFAGLFLWKAVK